MTISEELKAIIDDSKKKFDASYSKVEPLSKPSIFDDSDSALSFLLDTEIKNIKAVLKAKANEIKDQIEAEIKTKVKNLPNELVSTMVNLLYDMLYEFVDKTIKPIDEIYEEIMIKYNYMVRLYKKIIDIDTSEESKKEATKKFKEYILKIYEESPIPAQILAMYQLIENIKSIMLVMKNAKHCTKETYTRTANKLKATLSLFDAKKLKKDEKIKMILGLISQLLPILLAIGAAFTTNREIDDAVKDKISKLNEEENKKLKEKAATQANEIKEGSNIVKYATSNQNGFSYTSEPNNNVNDTTPTDVDYESMCIVDEPDDAINELSPKYKILELDKNEKKYSFIVNENSTIKNGDTIGYINDEAIKPKFDAIVHKINKNTITLKNTDIDITEKEINDLIKLASEQINTKSDIDKIVDKFNELNKIENNIKNYMLYTIIPTIPNMRIQNNEIITGNQYNGKSKDDIFKLIKSEYDIINNQFNDKIKQICSADSVKAYTEADNLVQLKDDILTEKTKFYNDFFDLYDNFQSKFGIYCLGDPEDYILLSDYMELSDILDYEDDYTGTKMLIQSINDIIKNRSIIEKSNKLAIIKSFNSFCEDILGKQTPDEQDYYTIFNSLFINKTSNLSNVNDSEIDIIYTKLYNYLANILNVPEITNNKETTNEGEDENYIIKKENIKKICRRFIIVKQINDLKHENKEINIQKTTKTEYDILNNIYKTTKTKYLELCNITDGKIFNTFKEAKIQKMDDVYYNKTKYEHYYVTSTEKNTKLIEKMLADRALQNPDALNSDSSPITEIGISDIRYWLKYCTYATLINTTLPMYWACGLLVAGAPVPMPIIYVPIYYLDSTVSILFGLGICGMAIYPMIVFINFNVNPASLLIPINMIIDQMYVMLDNMKNSATDKLKSVPTLEIQEIKKPKKDIDEQIRKINIEISKTKEKILSNGKIVKEINKKLKTPKI